MSHRERAGRGEIDLVGSTLSRDYYIYASGISAQYERQSSDQEWRVKSFSFLVYEVTLYECWQR